MARMLGLDVSRLSVPDYEIITRLERLIQNHHAQNAGLHPGECVQYLEHFISCALIYNI